MLATGPSLTIEDVNRVVDAGFLILGVNSIWKIYPHVDALYCGDYRYWKAYNEEIIAAGVTCKRYSRSSRAEKVYNASYCKSALGSAYNSGQMAVELAVRKGAEGVVMLGFDASVKLGIHFHGAHQKTPNPNPERASRWLPQFNTICKAYPHANIVNCSRYTAIKSIPVMTLEDYLESLPESAVRSARKEARLRDGVERARPHACHGLADK